MLYRILNDLDMYTHDPNIALNDEYYSKIYDNSEILRTHIFKIILHHSYPILVWKTMK